MLVCYFLLPAGLPSSRTGTEPLLGVQHETEVLCRPVPLSVRQRGAAVPSAGVSTGHQSPVLGCVPQQHVARVCSGLLFKKAGDEFCADKVCDSSVLKQGLFLPSRFLNISPS